MRSELSIWNNMKVNFVAKFNRYGQSIINGERYPTILLTDITDIFGNEITDHVWIRDIQAFRKIQLKEGDKIKFKGTVKKYIKGYRGDRNIKSKSYGEDYKIIYLNNIKKIT